MAITYLGDDRYRWTRKGRQPIEWEQLRLFGAAPVKRTIIRMAKKTPPARTDVLETFDGQAVVSTSVAVTGAGDGLSASLKVDPVILKIGDIVHIVIRCEVGKVNHHPVDKHHPEADLNRAHTLRAQMATIVDEDLVRESMAKQTRRFEEAAGKQRLDIQVGDGWDGDDGNVTQFGGQEGTTAVA